MYERNQFTFYRSYWEAIEELPEKDQLPILKAIIKYALFGEEPTTLSAVRRAVFLLVRPILDSSRKKAASGKQGGSKKKAKGKQPARENEIENEEEAEVENEVEIEYESNLSGGDGESAGAREADEKELGSIGLKPGEYTGVSAKVVESVKRMTQSLVLRYAPGRCCSTVDCRKVFILTAWGERVNGFVTIDNDAAELLEYAFETAYMNGKPGMWSYIEGVLNRCRSRNILTAEAAREWDEMRPDAEQGVGV